MSLNNTNQTIGGLYYVDSSILVIQHSIRYNCVTQDIKNLTALTELLAITTAFVSMRIVMP